MGLIIIASKKCNTLTVLEYVSCAISPDTVGKLAVRSVTVPALLCLWFTEGYKYLSRQYSIINAEIENMGTEMPKKPVEGRYYWVLWFKKSLLKVSSWELEDVKKFMDMWSWFSLIKVGSYFIYIYVCIKCINCALSLNISVYRSTLLLSKKLHVCFCLYAFF